MKHSSPNTVRGSRWAWHLSTVAGIPIRVHVTLLLMLLWIAWLEFHQASSQDFALHGSVRAWIVFLAWRVLFIVGLFSCVLFHEIGHALVARGYAIRTTEIMLYPFGGVARLHGMGNPAQELWISVAGPAVNLFIGLILFAALRFSGAWAPLKVLPLSKEILVQQLTLANFLLAIFNLIPAFPMDGGRILRALLARRFGMLRGTSTAALIGRAFAVGIAVFGLYLGNIVLVVIALFVFISAGQEVSLQHTLALMEGVSVGRVMVTSFETLPSHDSLAEAQSRSIATQQRDFPVMEAGQVVALLTRSDLLRGLAERGPRADVGAAARWDFPRLSPDETLQEALELIQSGGHPAALVFSGSQLVGVFSEDGVREFLQLRAMGVQA